MRDPVKAKRFRLLVAKERLRQERLFGTSHDALPLDRYLVKLGEETGEVMRHGYRHERGAMLAELVQVAAVAQRIYETFAL